MGPLAQTGVVGVLLVVLAVLVAVLLVVVPATLLVRSARARRARVTAQLEESRAEVALLGRRVEELSQEVLQARRLAAQEPSEERSPVREYVITSLASGATGAAPRSVATGADKMPLGRVLEDQLVGSLARQQDRSALRRQVVEAVVRTVSLGHGLRRALTPDNLDRAAAEAMWLAVGPVGSADVS